MIKQTNPTQGITGKGRENSTERIAMALLYSHLENCAHIAKRRYQNLKGSEKGRMNTKNMELFTCKEWQSRLDWFSFRRRLLTSEDMLTELRNGQWERRIPWFNREGVLFQNKNHKLSNDTKMGSKLGGRSGTGHGARWVCGALQQTALKMQNLCRGVGQVLGRGVCQNYRQTMSDWGNLLNWK